MLVKQAKNTSTLKETMLTGNDHISSLVVSMRDKQTSVERNIVIASLNLSLVTCLVLTSSVRNYQNTHALTNVDCEQSLFCSKICGTNERTRYACMPVNSWVPVTYWIRSSSRRLEQMEDCLQSITWEDRIKNNKNNRIQVPGSGIKDHA